MASPLCKCIWLQFDTLKREVLLSLSEVLPARGHVKSDKTVVNALGQRENPLTKCILISQLNAVFYDFMASKGVAPSYSFVPPKQWGISSDGLSVLIS